MGDTTNPPGTPQGGVWGTVKYVGSTTQMFACLGCLCFCLPGLLILCCPQDEKDGYAVNGTVYDAAGKNLGNAADVKFVPGRS